VREREREERAAVAVKASGAFTPSYAATAFGILISSATALPAGRDETPSFAEAHTAREEDERVGEIESQKMKLMRQQEAYVSLLLI
jgi:hypothetical protein